MNKHQIARWRMRNLGLWGSRFTDPKEVLAELGALQAQEFPYAKWSIGQRTGATDDSVQALFDRGTILRTHLLRPTWHFVAPADIRWILRLTAPRVRASTAASDRRLELDDRLSRRVNRLLEKALSGGKHLTRKEIIEILRRAKIDGTSQRFGHIVSRAELDEVICSGAMRGKQHTYALLDERVPQHNVLSGDEALAELARRYFLTRGPATVKDFAWWSSLRMADCRKAIELLDDELEQREVDDRTYWHAKDSEPPRARGDRFDLVQVYDECVVSYTLSRDALTDTVVGTTPTDMMFYWHPILLDGRLFGHWRWRTQAEPTEVELYFYVKPTPKQDRALTTAIKRLERFRGERLEVLR